MNPVDISLYGIVDPEHALERSVGELARAAAENGATLIQYRDKKNDIRKMIENAKAIRQGLEGTHVPLIVNDRVDVALACEADGVHLGQEDMLARDARRLLGPEAIIGISIKTHEHANACPVSEIDYAFVGGVFDTTSKDNPKALGLDGWLALANIIKTKEPNMPVGAIAGIDHINAREVMASGCDGIAVISALFRQDDIAASTRKLAALIREGKS